MSPPAATGASTGPVKLAGSVPGLWEILASTPGQRFAGLMATQWPEGLVLSAHLDGTGGIITHEAVLPAGAGSYPSLTPAVAAAFW